MRPFGIDSLLPPSLRTGPPEDRRRARLIVYALLIALGADLITAAFMPSVAWRANRGLWLAAHIASHAPTLLVLRATASPALAGHYFIAVIFLQVCLQYADSGGLAAFAFIGLPIAGTHLIGIGPGAAWTALGGVATWALPALHGMDSDVFGASAGIFTIALAVGVASAIVETTRARAVAEMRAAEEASRLHRERLRAFAEWNFPLIAETKDWKLAFVSDGVSELLGYTQAEVIERSMSLVRPDDMAAIGAQIAANPTGRLRVEARVRHQDGRWIWVEIFGTPYGETASDARFLFAARDIDEEVRRREQAEQSQRLEGVGVLAAGIAHDFNNLLTIVSGFGSTLPPSEAREEILRATTSAGELASQLLALGRADPQSDGRIDPARELEALEPVLRSVLDVDTRLITSAHTAGASIRLSAVRFKQIVLNLATNAREALTHGGQIAISLTRTRRESAEGGLAAGEYVELAVRDDGAGMSDEVRRRALDPFFSTKQAERHSGLGLASVYGIVRRSGGDLRIESVENGGTTVRVWLPLARPAEPASPLDAVPRSRLARAQVWVAEDEERIRRLVIEALSEAGHEPTPVSAAEAIARLERGARAPHALVTDVVMPGMRGTELAARLRALAPELRVLFVSGYSADETQPWLASEKHVAFLAKPFRRPDLERAVEALLA